jgi:hypothetical protein
MELKKQLSKDSMVTGAIAGIIAKIVQSILGFIIVTFIEPTYLNCIRIAGGLILAPQQVIEGGIWPYLLGLQIDFIVGIVVAVVAVLVFDSLGYDYYLLKGAMTGLISWAFFYVFLSQFVSKVHPEGNILQIQYALFTHLAFGISITSSIVWLRKNRY